MSSSTKIMGNGACALKKLWLRIFFNHEALCQGYIWGIEQTDRNILVRPHFAITMHRDACKPGRVSTKTYNCI